MGLFNLRGYLVQYVVDSILDRYGPLSLCSRCERKCYSFLYDGACIAHFSGYGLFKHVGPMGIWCNVVDSILHY